MFAISGTQCLPQKIEGFHKTLYDSPPPYSSATIGHGTINLSRHYRRLLRGMRFTMLHVLDHHLRSGRGHPEHKELVIDIYTCIERLAIEYALRRHKVIVSLKEKLLLVILDRRLGHLRR
jgi:hypothetical protein